MLCHLHAVPGNKPLVLWNVLHTYSHSVILYSSLVSLFRNEIVFSFKKLILSDCIFFIVSLHTAAYVFLSVYLVLTDFTSRWAALF